MFSTNQEYSNTLRSKSLNGQAARIRSEQPKLQAAVQLAAVQLATRTGGQAISIVHRRRVARAFLEGVVRHGFPQMPTSRVAVEDAGTNNCMEVAQRQQLVSVGAQEALIASTAVPQLQARTAAMHAMTIAMIAANITSRGTVIIKIQVVVLATCRTWRVDNFEHLRLPCLIKELHDQLERATEHHRHVSRKNCELSILLRFIRLRLVGIVALRSVPLLAHSVRKEQ